jgi:hypothetical protein
MRHALLLLVSTWALAGCSLLYDIGQAHALESCDRASSAQDRTACRKANSQNYDDYEAHRKRMKEGQPG